MPDSEVSYMLARGIAHLVTALFQRCVVAEDRTAFPLDCRTITDFKTPQHSFLHALFIIMASVGCVYSGVLKNRARRQRRIVRNRAQMVRYAEERRRQMEVEKAHGGAPAEGFGQAEERIPERSSRGTEASESTELEGSERKTRERLGRGTGAVS